MTAHQDSDASIDGSDDLEEPTGRVVSTASNAVSSGTVPLVGGGLLLAAAVRAMARKRARAIPLAVAGSGLLGFGLRARRSEPASDGPPEVEGGTEGKETSDAASAAARRPDSGRESELEADGEISDDPGIDGTTDAGSGIGFTDVPDDAGSRPDLGADEADPRHDTDRDGVAVDVSDTAMADETSEATGPDPTQAQPTRTEDTEPEESPAEDASHMKVDPPDADGAEAESDAAADDGTDESDR
jgi:hypothetical protein